MAYRWQERTASLIAAVGSIWFVYDLTSNFHRMIQVLPPTGGPTELIGIAILIWLHAKHRRILDSRLPVFAQFPETPLTGELVQAS